MIASLGISVSRAGAIDKHLTTPASYSAHYYHHTPVINAPPLFFPITSAFLFRLYQRKHWYMPIVDIFRRLALTSGLLVILDPTIQLLVALAVSVSFVVAFREWKPFYEIETDSLFYICGKLPLH